ncbi:MAG TPA: L-threonylcarbamoyladenylate synthase [Streptosporangiaceae bacterium]|nr:L-threonylcarbamoyladenylate synthase [Streptosporangiaceae bacterium]
MDERVRAEVDRVAACLLAGGVVLLPTDTVYGLAVHPGHDDAITRLFAMKGRPRSVNLPVMISSRDDILALGGVVSEAAELLLESKYVPGPLTLAVGVSPPNLVPWLRGRIEFAVRVPDDERLLGIIAKTGPLLVTSANLHAEQVRESVPEIVSTLAREPDLVIDDGNRDTVPSTLVNCRLVPPVVERVGAVPQEEIEAVLR